MMEFFEKKQSFIDGNPATSEKSGMSGHKWSKWKVAGAYTPGRLHLQKNIPCQDRIHSLDKKDVNVKVISLSDGAGFYQFSHFGAEVITQSICENMVKMFDEIYTMNDTQIKDRIMDLILQDLKIKSQELNTDVKELSSTLLFVAIKSDKYIAGHIGDGVIGYSFDDNINILSYPENDEYANITYFVTSSNVKEHFRIYRGEIINTTGFILMSDGSAERLYDKKNKKISIAAKQILDWLDNNSSSDVEIALKNNLEKISKEKTLDDCSINLIRLVKKDINELNNMTLDLQKEFLNSKYKIIVENRLKIINSISTSNDLQSIAKETGLSISTVKKHVDFLVKDGILKLEGTKIIIN